MVTPFMGVWIEIIKLLELSNVSSKSLPLWECGLKSIIGGTAAHGGDVTPFMGVWIEIRTVKGSRQAA